MFQDLKSAVSPRNPREWRIHGSGYWMCAQCYWAWPVQPTVVGNVHGYAYTHKYACTHKFYMCSYTSYV